MYDYDAVISYCLHVLACEIVGSILSASHFTAQKSLGFIAFLNDNFLALRRARDGVSSDNPPCPCVVEAPR